MKNYQEIPDEICKLVRESKSLAIWPIEESPMVPSFQAGRYFQDHGWDVYPVHDTCERTLDVMCYRDIRLIPDDYDILYLFCDPDRLPIIVNEIFNADFIPPLVITHEGIIDLESLDRLTDGGVKIVMDIDLVDLYKWCMEME